MRACPLLASTLLTFLAGTAQAGSVLLPAMGGINVTNIESIQERGFSRTVHQQYDFSCGSAAVATLLTYQYHTPISEHDVFMSMWDQGDQEKIRSDGFSLLDIKRYLDAQGYESNGYEVPLEKLIENSIPAIMLISDHGYNHFVVLKGVDKDRVLLGDPSTGARVMSLERFKKILVTPIIFVITSHREQAVFNGRADWKTKPLAPIGTALSAARLTQETIFPGLLKPGAF